MDLTLLPNEKIYIYWLQMLLPNSIPKYIMVRTWKIYAHMAKMTIATSLLAISTVKATYLHKLDLNNSCLLNYEDALYVASPC